ncbi:unnamed protein product [Sphagnum tenellum]
MPPIGDAFEPPPELPLEILAAVAVVLILQPLPDGFVKDQYQLYPDPAFCVGAIDCVMIARNGLLSRGINFENVLRVLEGVGSRVHRLTGRARKSGTTTPVLPSTTTKIGCREILPTDLEAVINLLTTGFQRDRQYWVNAIHRLSEHTTPSGFPKYGYLLESDGVLVGVLLAIFTSRIEDGTISVRCNGSSLYVAPAFRAYVPLLIKRYERAKNVTYLNITPAPRTWAMVEAQGYKRFSNGLQIVLYFQWLSIRHLPNVKIETINHHDERLPSFESDLLADHAGYGFLADEPIPTGYKLIWHDEFTSLSLRSGGPTYDGLAGGTGTWAAPGATYSADPRGVAGYGYDWFVDPSYYGWTGYTGPFTITAEGLRIRAERPPAAMATTLPPVSSFNWARNRKDHFLINQSDQTPWLSGQLSTPYSVRISPPFYIEARAKMPVGISRPFPAIWLITGGMKTDEKQSYEIDIHEGFGDSDRLHSTIHVNGQKVYPVVDMPSGVELSKGFNTWGCLVTKEKQTFYFNNVEVGHIETPAGANANKPYMLILDVSAGLPWKGGGPPSGGPHDMIVRYLGLYAPDSRGLSLK